MKENLKTTLNATFLNFFNNTNNNDILFHNIQSYDREYLTDMINISVLRSKLFLDIFPILENKIVYNNNLLLKIFDNFKKHYSHIKLYISNLKKKNKLKSDIIFRDNNTNILYRFYHIFPILLTDLSDEILNKQINTINNALKAFDYCLKVLTDRKELLIEKQIYDNLINKFDKIKEFRLHLAQINNANISMIKSMNIAGLRQTCLDMLILENQNKELIIIKNHIDEFINQLDNIEKILKSFENSSHKKIIFNLLQNHKTDSYIKKSFKNNIFIINYLLRFCGKFEQNPVESTINIISILKKVLDNKIYINNVSRSKYILNIAEYTEYNSLKFIENTENLFLNMSNDICKKLDSFARCFSSHPLYTDFDIFCRKIIMSYLVEYNKNNILIYNKFFNLVETPNKKNKIYSIINSLNKLDRSIKEISNLFPKLFLIINNKYYNIFNKLEKLNQSFISNLQNILLNKFDFKKFMELDYLQYSIFKNYSYRFIVNNNYNIFHNNENNLSLLYSKKLNKNILAPIVFNLEQYLDSIRSEFYLSKNILNNIKTYLSVNKFDKMNNLIQKNEKKLERINKIEKNLKKLMDYNTQMNIRLFINNNYFIKIEDDEITTISKQPFLLYQLIHNIIKKQKYILYNKKIFYNFSMKEYEGITINNMEYLMNTYVFNKNELYNSLLCLSLSGIPDNYLFYFKKFFFRDLLYNNFLHHNSIFLTNKIIYNLICIKAFIDKLNYNINLFQSMRLIKIDENTGKEILKISSHVFKKRYADSKINEYYLLKRQHSDALFRIINSFLESIDSFCNLFDNKITEINNFLEVYNYFCLLVRDIKNQDLETQSKININGIDLEKANMQQIYSAKYIKILQFISNKKDNFINFNSFITSKFKKIDNLLNIYSDISGEKFYIIKKRNFDIYNKLLFSIKKKLYDTLLVYGDKNIISKFQKYMEELAIYNKKDLLLMQKKKSYFFYFNKEHLNNIKYYFSKNIDYLNITLQLGEEIEIQNFFNSIKKITKIDKLDDLDDFTNFFTRQRDASKSLVLNRKVIIEKLKPFLEFYQKEKQYLESYSSIFNLIDKYNLNNFLVLINRSSILYLAECNLIAKNLENLLKNNKKINSIISDSFLQNIRTLDSILDKSVENSLLNITEEQLKIFKNNTIDKSNDLGNEYGKIKHDKIFNIIKIYNSQEFKDFNKLMIQQLKNLLRGEDINIINWVSIDTKLYLLQEQFGYKNIFINGMNKIDCSIAFNNSFRNHYEKLKKIHFLLDNKSIYDKEINKLKRLSDIKIDDIKPNNYCRKINNYVSIIDELSCLFNNYNLNLFTTKESYMLLPENIKNLSDEDKKTITKCNKEYFFKSIIQKYALDLEIKNCKENVFSFKNNIYYNKNNFYFKLDFYNSYINKYFIEDTSDIEKKLLGYSLKDMANIKRITL